VTGPIVAQAGTVCLELRETRPGRWDVWSAGERIGRGISDGFGVAIHAGGVTVRGVSAGRAAVAAAVRLDESYRAWRAQLPVRCSDAGLASGEVA
jgi:hypothetical protein